MSGRTPQGLVGGPVYLDYNATTPVDPAVVEAIVPFLAEHFANPSSSYEFGRVAKAALIRARQQVATLIGAGAGQVVFTGSGSEADALGIRGAVLAGGRAEGRHVITQATEHPAVLAACAELRDVHGVEVTVLPVDAAGVLDPDAVEAALTPATALVTVMLANNETGTLQPVAEIARRAHARGVPVHCDAAQAVGKIPVDVSELGVDLLTVVGHKMYAPKGISALWVGPGTSLRPLVGGGGQESGLRAGTENVAYAVGLGAAAELAGAALARGESQRLAALRDRLEHALGRNLAGRTSVNGHVHLRLPNTSNLTIDGVRALDLLAGSPGVAASAGSACHAGLDSPSPVLTAMGIPGPRAMSAVRLSVGRWTTEAEVDRAADLILDATSRL